MLKGRKFTSAVVCIPSDGAIHIFLVSAGAPGILGFFFNAFFLNCMFEIDVFKLINRICLPAFDIRLVVGFTMYIFILFY